MPYVPESIEVASLPVGIRIQRSVSGAGDNPAPGTTQETNVNASFGPATLGGLLPSRAHLLFTG